MVAVVLAARRVHARGRSLCRQARRHWCPEHRDRQSRDEPVWSLDGKRVAFIRGRAGLEGEDIWVVNNDGTGLANLTQGIAENDNSPAWSPDGARIAFISQRGDGTQNDLWVMSSNGSGATMLDVKSVSPMWSADGTKLQYSSYKSGRLQIWVANADESNSANVSNSTSPETDPVWSTDGTMLAVMGTRSAAGPAIYIMNADGSNQQALAASLQNRTLRVVARQQADCVQRLARRRPARRVSHRRQPTEPR